jgi:hypothetical protein
MRRVRLGEIDTADQVFKYPMRVHDELGALQER